MVSYMIELNGPVDPIGESEVLELIKKIISIIKWINYPISMLLEINSILKINTCSDRFYIDFCLKSTVENRTIGNFSDWYKKPMG